MMSAVSSPPSEGRLVLPARLVAVSWLVPVAVGSMLASQGAADAAVITAMLVTCMLVGAVASMAFVRARGHVRDRVPVTYRGKMIATAVTVTVSVVTGACTAVGCLERLGPVYLLHIAQLQGTARDVVVLLVTEPVWWVVVWLLGGVPAMLATLVSHGYRWRADTT